MYLDVSTLKQNGKSYTRYLLRESYREDGKVKHRTIANLSRCSPQEVEAIRLALRHKEDLSQVGPLKGSISSRQGLSVGAVCLVYEISHRLGIVEALGPTREGKLALWQVMARVINQGSRLSAVRLAGSHAACDLLNVGTFDEADLYKNLDWLCEKQEGIEDRLYRKLHKNGSPGLFLYDVTSSYLEGEQNELAAFGYNRDGKRGKRQIVIGLLCNAAGAPLSIEVFTGNTSDPKTVASQIRKVADRFGGGDVTFVGDRGMIKSQQVEDLGSFHYITAITKPQIQTLLQSLFQMTLFDQTLAEVEDNDGIRYILRRNPIRADEIQATREEKYQSVLKGMERENRYLQEHPRSKVEVAQSKVEQRLKRLKISDWAILSVCGRVMSLSKDPVALASVSELDGCYVLKTDLSCEQATKEVVHARYKDLAQVEWAFRTMKTTQLEMRPVYVRKESRTRGHAFVVMLAYRIIKELASRWASIDMTVEEGIRALTTLCAVEIKVQGKASCQQIPEPRESIQRLLKAADVRLPKVLPSRGIIVTTKKKLQERRKKTKNQSVVL
ncbi:MAG: IS1634 family transposase [Patescibacteria group bacterium]